MLQETQWEVDLPKVLPLHLLLLLGSQVLQSQSNHVSHEERLKACEVPTHSAGAGWIRLDCKLLHEKRAGNIEEKDLSGAILRQLYERSASRSDLPLRSIQVWVCIQVHDGASRIGKHPNRWWHSSNRNLLDSKLLPLSDEEDKERYSSDAEYIRATRSRCTHACSDRKVDRDKNRNEGSTVPWKSFSNIQVDSLEVGHTQHDFVLADHHREHPYLCKLQ